MELVVKSLREMTPEEVFALFKLRVAVFVVEQKCPYQEVDDLDLTALHVFLRDETGIQACLRTFAGDAPGRAVIGRVIAARRRCGLGSRVMTAGIRTAAERLGARVITLEAQVYARKFYENLGFRATSEEFLMDDIPHVAMELRLTDFAPPPHRTDS